MLHTQLEPLVPYNCSDIGVVRLLARRLCKTSLRTPNLTAWHCVVLYFGTLILREDINSAWEKGMEIGPMREWSNLLDMNYSDPEWSLILFPAMDTCLSQSLVTGESITGFPQLCCFRGRLLPRNWSVGLVHLLLKANIFPMYLEDQSSKKDDGGFFVCLFVYFLRPTLVFIQYIIWKV